MISSSILIFFDIAFVINPIDTPTLKVPVSILLKIRKLSLGKFSQIFLISSFLFSSSSANNLGNFLFNNSFRDILSNFLFPATYSLLSNKLITSAESPTLR